MLRAPIIVVGAGAAGLTAAIRAAEAVARATLRSWLRRRWRGRWTALAGVSTLAHWALQSKKGGLR